MTNYVNSQYTVRVELGSPPQTLQAIPDTGSYELLVASTACEDDCGGGNHTLFDAATSSTLLYSSGNGGALGQYTSYGQGEVLSVLVTDTVSVGGMFVNNVPFLMMLQNELKDFDYASYDAIMGIGPFASANIPSEDHERPRPSIMSAMNITSVGVCLSQLDGANGRLDLNGGVPGLTYTPFPSIGQYHWGLSVSGITANGHSFGCARPPYCAAIVDSGTSLITLPTPLLTELTPLMNSVKADCSNMHELPTLYLSVNGRELKLPPQLWVMRVQDSPVVKKAVYNIPGYKSMALPFYTGQYADECFPAIEAVRTSPHRTPLLPTRGLRSPELTALCVRRRWIR
jgi:hypothetical protein